MNVPKRHHYVPESYLHGFAGKDGDKPALHVIDKRDGVMRWSNPRSEGAETHFYRIEGPEPGSVENGLSTVESEQKRMFGEIAELRALPTGEAFDMLMELIALQAVRGPSLREASRKFYSDVAGGILDVLSHSDQAYESTRRRLLAEGVVEEDVPSREDLKAGAALEWEVGNAAHVHAALSTVPGVARVLALRKWTLLVAAPESLGFVTSDAPVALQAKSEPLPWGTPGFGVPGTVVLFPIDRSIALLGDFDSGGTTMAAERRVVAMVNSAVAFGARRFVWSRRPRFDYLDGRDLRRDPEHFLKIAQRD